MGLRTWTLSPHSIVGPPVGNVRGHQSLEEPAIARPLSSGAGRLHIPDQLRRPRPQWRHNRASTNIPSGSDPERLQRHRAARRAPHWQKNPWERFLPFHAYRLHQDSKAFLERQLGANPPPTVVVSHHLPHPRSLPERFNGDLLNAAYASDLSDVIKVGAPALWVHGHTHDSCAYVIHHTRVISKPRGYGDENSVFDAQLVVHFGSG